MKRRAPNGFTLLEVLLSISLATLIVVSILNGFHLGKRAWEASSRKDEVDEVEAALRSIEAELKRAFPAPVASSAASRLIAFEGGAQRCRFVALGEIGAYWGGLITTDVGVYPVQGRAQLSFYTRVFRASEFGIPRAEMTYSPVLGTIGSFSLAYFGVPEGRREPIWSDTWERRRELPRLVRVTIEIIRSGRVIRALSVVALRQR